MAIALCEGGRRMEYIAMFKFLLIGFTMFVVGCSAGFFILRGNAQPSPSVTESCLHKYSYINGSLNCEPKHIINKSEYSQLTYHIEEYINEEKRKERVSHVSVYFRDLVGGPTFDVEGDSNFVPASLLKVPLMMTYFSLAEKNPELLKEKTSYKEVMSEVKQSIFSEEVIQKNVEYSVKELIERMIINSDNLAYGLLIEHLESKFPNSNVYLATLKELGLINPRSVSDSTLTVKSYASLFRQLYNSSYLSAEMSDNALELLTRTKFNKALASGVPKDIIVAHKFGDREGLSDNEKQFHDCGIIYYPDNPYLLCIMTRGSSDDNLILVIKTISSMVYKEVNSRKI